MRPQPKETSVASDGQLCDPDSEGIASALYGPRELKRSAPERSIATPRCCQHSCESGQRGITKTEYGPGRRAAHAYTLAHACSTRFSSCSRRRVMSLRLQAAPSE